MLNGVEHANFFENRATEYSKASTAGTWDEAFAKFAPARRARFARVAGGRLAGPLRDASPKDPRRRANPEWLL